MRWSVLVFILGAIACGAAHVAILAAVMRRRSAVIDRNVPRPRSALEIIWALVPAIAVAALLAATWHKVRAHDTTEAARVVRMAR
jgi:heme/copper-type cytochrome/quinol oxidase subunit 2